MATATTGVKPKPRPRAKAAEKKVASKKGVASKASTSTTSTRGKKTPPKTTAARGKVAGKATAKAPAPRKKAAPKKTVVATPAIKRELNELGFMDGSDSATIAACLVEGGADRQDVNNLVIERIEKSTGLTNRNGDQKYIPSMVSGILGRMLKTGEWEVHASWQLVPVEKPAKKVARKRK